MDYRSRLAWSSPSVASLSAAVIGQGKWLPRCSLRYTKRSYVCWHCGTRTAEVVYMVLEPLGLDAAFRNHERIWLCGTCICRFLPRVIQILRDLLRRLQDSDELALEPPSTKRDGEEFGVILTLEERGYLKINRAKADLWKVAPKEPEALKRLQRLLESLEKSIYSRS